MPKCTTQLYFQGASILDESGIPASIGAHSSGGSVKYGPGYVELTFSIDQNRSGKKIGRMWRSANLPVADALELAEQILAAVAKITKPINSIEELTAYTHNLLDNKENTRTNNRRRFTKDGLKIGATRKVRKLNSGERVEDHAKVMA